MASPIASIIILATTFAAVILLDIFGRRRYIKQITIAGMIIALLMLYFSSLTLSTSLFKSDAFTLFFSGIFLLVAAFVVMSSREATAVYNGSILLSTIGMVIACGANDLLLLYISIELVTSPTYVLVAYHKTAKRMEAAMKYFIVGIVASALLLFGLALIVSVAGTSSIPAIGVSTAPLFILGVAAFIAGLGFKLGMFPFNFWIPDVYEGAPPEIAGLLAGASKKVAYAVLLRIAVVIAMLHSWSTLIAILAGLTMTIANITALLQTNMRRLLAYSIMSQAGFLLLGVACATALGYAATAFHAFTHAFMALGAFLVLGVFFSHHVETIEDARGLGWKNPLLGVSLTIFLLSLAGIPLLAGFASKFYLFYATLSAGFFWLAVLAIVNSVISLYYYAKVIRALYAYPGGGHPFPLRLGTKIAILCCLILTILAGIYPQPFIAFATRAVDTLF